MNVKAHSQNSLPQYGQSLQGELQILHKMLLLLSMFFSSGLFHYEIPDLVGEKKVDTIMDKVRLFNSGQENNSNIIVIIL